MTGKTGDDGVAYACALRIIRGEADMLGATLCCHGDCDLLCAGATSFRHEDPVQAALSMLDDAEAVGYDAIRAAHVADLSAIMDRCDLSLPEDAQLEALPTDERLRRFAGGEEDFGLINGYFRFGRYLLACVWVGKLFGVSVAENSFVPDGDEPVDTELLALLRRTADEVLDEQRE